MKLSFSIPSKPSSKPNPKASQNFNDDEQGATEATHEYLTEFGAETTHETLTEFDASKTLTRDPQSNKPIIPPKENEWRPYKKMKNLHLPVPSDDPNLQFELESHSMTEALDSAASYGLHLRKTTKPQEDADHDKKPQSESEVRSRPASIDNLVLHKLKNDLKRLPEDRGFDEYTDRPVEGFGAALLAGYGWYEGRGIGKNEKDVESVQYERRTAKEGIGFFNDYMPNNGKKEGERNTKKEGLYVGKDVRIVGGENAGLKGRIVGVLEGRGSKSVVLKLSRSEEEVVARDHEVVELGSVEEERCLRKLKGLKISRVKDSSSSDDRRSYRVKDKRRDSKRSGEGKERRGEVKHDNGALQRTSQVSWLTSHIRVRVISKKFKGGRLYLKKGEVVDVVGPTTCDISMDDSRELVQGVDQELIETALPRRGGPVLVLHGEHKGVYGNLVEKDMEKETGVIRDSDSHALLNVRLEQIAEYIGDPSYIGY